jgi:hypothetical protein
VTRFYRIARNKPAILEDLLSHEASGKVRPKRVPPERWAAVSMFDTVENALTMLADLPKLGEFLAILELPDEVRRERTGPSPGHYSVYETGENLIGYLINTIDAGLGAGCRRSRGTRRRRWAA